MLLWAWVLLAVVREQQLSSRGHATRNAAHVLASAAAGVVEAECGPWLQAAGGMGGRLVDGMLIVFCLFSMSVVGERGIGATACVGGVRRERARPEH